MSNDIWMPLYIGDYLADTMHLTCEEHGAYLLLIMACWKNGGMIDAKTIPMICRLDAERLNAIWPNLSEFFERKENWIISKRASMELEKAGVRSRKAKNAASKRWTQPEETSNPPEDVTETIHENTEDSLTAHQFVVQQFNAVAPIQCSKLTDRRRKALSTRLRDKSWNWQEALNRVPECPFLNGDNRTGWKMDFDFFLKPDSVNSILEGKYDGKPQNSNASERREEANQLALAEFVRTSNEFRRVRQVNALPYCDEEDG